LFADSLAVLWISGCRDYLTSDQMLFLGCHIDNLDSILNDNDLQLLDALTPLVPSFWEYSKNCINEIPKKREYVIHELYCSIYLIKFHSLVLKPMSEESFT